MLDNGTAIFIREPEPRSSKIEKRGKKRARRVSRGEEGSRFESITATGRTNFLRFDLNAASHSRSIEDLE